MAIESGGNVDGGKKGVIAMLAITPILISDYWCCYGIFIKYITATVLVVLALGQAAVLSG